ncbi:hypothetical protein FN846DRAFT_122023 [Sphaerosporella brunnea]|uniref:MPN domain-containing protein n=1 Tax=Sphaerosporella brunnea TaxID=1250544 RepID=A0A5J5ESP7_9PEZI|nr:hypothetical protein FN846DRAFT_122023 [Sphaerosporella brunnea]
MEFDYASVDQSPASARRSSAPPLSVKEIADNATHFDYNPLISLKYWLRTADTLRKEADIYRSEGDEQHAYFLLLRWVELVLQHLLHHPDRFQPENALSLSRAQHRAPEALQILEQLKPRLDARYQSYVESRRRANDTTVTPRLSSTASTASSSATSTASSTARKKNAPTPLDHSMQRRMPAASLTGPFSPLKSPPPEKSDFDSRNLALEIARQEFEKREREKREHRRLAALESGGVIYDHTGREIWRVGTPGVANFPFQRSNHHSPYETYEQRVASEAGKAMEDEEALVASVKALSMGIDPGTLSPAESRRSYHPPDHSNRDSISAYEFKFGGLPQFSEEPVKVSPTVERWTASYPTVPKPQHSPSSFFSQPIPIPMPGSPPPPPPPPKISNAPALPPKVCDYDISTIPAVADKAVAKEFSMPATLESGEPLRTMFLPATLRQNFLLMAEPNTNANLEMCGILCGTLIQNALFVTRLVIPEQETTSDTCTTKDEEAFFEYCNAEELMVLGWIHTHPTQTCFMSSVDLHTHAGYQLMMKESIAIVCAPTKDPSWGVFRLTDPPGVQTIISCRQKGLFHPHGKDNIYTDAMRPGHVCIVEEMGFDIVDLRKGN